ncbi:hypothetical protein EZV62_023603 [Acer yangbiense]|uniref:Cytochrome P450 n=1 Tax=Acer yangbiense TaxID=1000413 RepID=A0A5C7H2U3_9ROSI|nr:hypothetical protein EZV62_023603 [Acer yangbiense]
MVEWTMAELMQHPEVMKKVQEELTEVVGIDNSIEESHLPKLRYLDAVVKETMRLHPALPLLVPRCPSQSTIFGGYTIPKGARIMLNVWPFIGILSFGTILWNFYLKELDLSDKFGIVIKKLKPLVVIPTPRLYNSELY